MAPGADKGGNLGGGDTKGGNLGKAANAMKSLESKLSQARGAADKLTAKSKTLPKGAQANVKKLAVIKAAIGEAARLKAALKGLQNKRKST